MNYEAAAAEVRRWRVERAGIEAVWLVKIRARLRQGPATTHELGQACDIAPGREFGMFRQLLDKTACIARAGQTLGPTGHMNILWQLREEPSAT